MKRFVLLSLLISAISFYPESSVLYVDIQADGNGDGTSWHDAYRCLHKALETATQGTDIHIAQGVYYTDKKGGSRNRYFYLGEDIRLIGGFKTGGKDRDWDTYKTILSGDIERDDRFRFGTLRRNESNAYRIIFSHNAKGSVLDGLIISGAYGCSNRESASGSAVEVAAWDSDSSVYFTIRNTSFFNNRTFGNGAAVNFKGKNIHIENSQFVNNKVLGSESFKSGGALYSDCHKTFIINSRFENNSAPKGGACFVNGYTLNSSGNLFSENFSQGDGGAAIWFSGQYVNIRNSKFTGNRAKKGVGGAVAFSGQNLFVDGSKFLKNTAKGSGAINFHGDRFVLTNSIAKDNKVQFNAGCFSVNAVEFEITSNRFERNSAQGGYGGVVYFEGTNLYSRNNVYLENYALGGGALYLKMSQLAIYNDTLTNNVAQRNRGGALYFEGDTCTVVASRFSSNSANNGSGGALSFMGKRLKLDSTSFIENRADTAGSLFFNNDIGDENTVHKGLSGSVNQFYGNTATTKGGAIYWVGRGILNDSRFVNNKAQYGAAIYSWYYKEKDSEFVIDNSILKANEKSVISNTVFKDNKSIGASLPYKWPGLFESCNIEKKK
ncbi:hypothetical protein QA601_13995 [Chitinispirillales bacterium ANBcel5]|uniref:hypothetical protein n=1 Tax=Cellulosispirillum alkaliphilum TaxID=3039283 RepID=UPI002A4FBA41|nr:hypothetical protein [Chitinispirillales bacterium ANBcel5]